LAETEMPRSAKIASWLGKFGPSCALAGILGIQIGVVPPLGGFMFLQLGLLSAIFSLGFGITAVIVTRGDTDGPGRAAGWLGMASGMVMLSLTIVGAGTGAGSPPINDITTDVTDPPSFASAADIPDFEGRDMIYPPDFVEIVKDHYDYLESLHVDQHPTSAYEKAIATGQSLGWEIVHQDPERLMINARETSFVFKFVDDIVIRVKPDGSGAILDLRSKSRDGQGDLGANAERIVEFMLAFVR
jgi:uncharacterized protein (DUF1499 family)